jgi:hypothetical protein
MAKKKACSRIWQKPCPTDRTSNVATRRRASPERRTAFASDIRLHSATNSDHPDNVVATQKHLISGEISAFSKSSTLIIGADGAGHGHGATDDGIRGGRRRRYLGRLGFAAASYARRHIGEVGETHLTVACGDFNDQRDYHHYYYHLHHTFARRSAKKTNQNRL